VGKGKTGDPVGREILPRLGRKVKMTETTLHGSEYCHFMTRRTGCEKSKRGSSCNTKDARREEVFIKSLPPKLWHGNGGSVIAVEEKLR